MSKDNDTQITAMTTTKNISLYDISFSNNLSSLPGYGDEQQGTGERTLVDAFTHRMFDIVNYIVISGLIGLFGIVANVVNMVVYFRIGIFTSASNLNLFSLAIADFGVSLTIFAQSIGYAIITADIPNLSFNPFDVVYITISWPNMIFTMANRLITPYVALERCVCVVSPFKVKTLFTKKRSLFCLSILFGYSVLSHVPIFATHRLKHTFEPTSNRTKLILVFSAHSDIMYDISMNTNVFAVSFITVVLVFALTLITASQIKLSAQWRKSMSQSVRKKSTGKTTHIESTEESSIFTTTSVTFDDIDDNAKSGKENVDIDTTVSKKKKIGHRKLTNKTIDKETKLVKMITLVSVIYIVLYLPEMIMIVVMFVDKRISTYGEFWRLSEILYSFTYPTGALNSSINIFVYYRMSSMFRLELRKLIGVEKA